MSCIAFHRSYRGHMASGPTEKEASQHQVSRIDSAMHTDRFPSHGPMQQRTYEDGGDIEDDLREALLAEVPVLLPLLLQLESQILPRAGEVLELPTLPVLVSLALVS
jgi:hypothetical protein